MLTMLLPRCLLSSAASIRLSAHAAPAWLGAHVYTAAHLNVVLGSPGDALAAEQRACEAPMQGKGVVNHPW